MTGFSQTGQIASGPSIASIATIASMRRVHEAFRWLHLHEQQMMRWQVEVVSIPAPPFGEEARATWLVERFDEIGLADAHLDSAGNALAMLPGRAGIVNQHAPVLLLSAHIDTVFPAHTPIEPVLEGSRLIAPGACDNGAGVVALLALASALLRAGIEPETGILLAGNVGEEGEGDLRGMRHLYNDPRWRGRIAAHLVLDGAGHEIAVTGALGSSRFEVRIDGSGGHSWTDAGRPNPIVALGETIAIMNRVRLVEDEPTGEVSSRAGSVDASGLFASPGEAKSGRVRAQGLTYNRNHAGWSQLRSAWNVGTIEGGASVNSIPEYACARFDLRSTDAEQLVRLEVELHRAVEDAVLAINALAETQGAGGHSLRFSIERIGSRPAGTLPESARMLDLVRAVDRHLNLRTEYRTASTDANIPLSLGVEAVSIGAGGDGGGIHTRGEWYDGRGRDLGLRRVMLLLLALAVPAERAMAAD